MEPNEDDNGGRLMYRKLGDCLVMLRDRVFVRVDCVYSEINDSVSRTFVVVRKRQRYFWYSFLSHYNDYNSIGYKGFL